MKVAFFVEGYTEQSLIKNILLYNFNLEDLSFALFRVRGGGKSPLKIILDERHDATSGSAKYTFNIYDCMGFTALQSMISYQATSLYKNGFEKIVGIRDVHPHDRSEIPKLKMSMPYGMPQKPIAKHFMLCVMETEAWFIANEEHFLKISEILTRQFILDNTGIDVQTVDVESIDLPAETLNQIYLLAGESYEKTIPCLKRTVESLDLFHLIMDTGIKSPSLGELLSHLENK